MAAYSDVQGLGSTKAEAKQALSKSLTDLGISELAIARIINKCHSVYDNPDGGYIATPTSNKAI